MPENRRLYSSGFFDRIDTASRDSAAAMLPPLVDILKPASAIELGAGAGAWSGQLLALGLSEVIAVDGEWQTDRAMHVPRAAFRAHDLQTPLDLNRRFDLAIALEVAEHLAESAADVFVSSLTRHADVVLFSAAMPLQGGTNHINEQPPSYWIAKFSERGYACLDIIRPMFWNNRNVATYYKQNGYLFAHESRTELIATLRDRQARLYEGSSSLWFVHPDQYLEVASYRSVSPRRLIPMLPRILLRDVFISARRRFMG